MKSLRSLLLAAAAMMAVGSYAQVDDTFVFLDADGNEIPSGSTVTFTEVEADEFLGENVIHCPIYVKNNTEDKQGVGGTLTLESIDNGRFQICFPVVCTEGMKEPGEKFLDPQTIMQPGEKKNIQAEWFTEGEGSCKATLQLSLYEIVTKRTGIITTETTGDEIETDDPMPSLTLVCANGVTGINDVLTVDNTKVEAVYSADGKRLSAMQKGLNIVKLSDGKTLKVVK